MLLTTLISGYTAHIAIVYCYEHLLDLYTSMRGHQRYKYNQPKQIDIGCNDTQSICLMWGDCQITWYGGSWVWYLHFEKYHGNRSKDKVIEIVKKHIPVIIDNSETTHHRNVKLPKIFLVVLDTIFDVITHLLCQGILFDVMTIFLMSWRIFNAIVCFRRNDELFDVMTWFFSALWRFLTSWQTFLSSWRIFDIVMIFLTSWWSFWRNDVFFYIMADSLSSWRFWLHDVF